MTTATQGEVYGQARVLAPSLNLRTGPHVSYTAVAYLMEGEVVNLVGRNRTSTWVQIHLYNGYRGWVNAAYVQPGIAIDALPIVDVSLLGITAFVTNDPIPVYTGPGTTYQLIDSARPGDVLALNGRDAAATWVHVYLPDGRGGWAAAGSSFLPSASLNDLPILTPFLDAPPPDLAPFFLVYDGPGFLYEPVDNVSQGQTLAILARSDDSRWIKIQLSNGRAGWIAAEIVQIDAALANVPVIEGVAPPQVVGWQASSQTRDANGSSATPSGGKPALATPTATPEPTQPLEATKPAKPSITPSPTIAPTQTSTTVATATPTSTPQATSTTAAPTGTAEATPEEGSAPPPGIPIVYVYTTPDETAEVLLRIVPGQSVVLVGRTADEKWIKIWLPGDQEGWVKADVLQLDIDVAVLPVVDP